MNRKEIYKIMKETCFGSISFCCGLSNHCPYRDDVLKKLSLTKKDFIILKKQFDDELIKLVKRRKK